MSEDDKKHMNNFIDVSVIGSVSGSGSTAGLREVIERTQTEQQRCRAEYLARVSDGGLPILYPHHDLK